MGSSLVSRKQSVPLSGSVTVSVLSHHVPRYPRSYMMPQALSHPVSVHWNLIPHQSDSLSWLPQKLGKRISRESTEPVQSPIPIRLQLSHSMANHSPVPQFAFHPRITVEQKAGWPDLVASCCFTPKDDSRMHFPEEPHRLFIHIQTFSSRLVLCNYPGMSKEWWSDLRVRSASMPTSLWANQVSCYPQITPSRYLRYIHARPMGKYSP